MVSGGTVVMPNYPDLKTVFHGENGLLINLSVLKK